MKCPVCLNWSDHCYPASEKAERLADHIAEHSMLDCVLALMRPAAPVERKACPKVGYPDEQAATAALLHAWRHPSPRRRERRYYRCDCGYFHLTSQPARESTP